MSDKFQNKYRISSARLKNWDYGSNAIYFVTICTQNREHYFGNIADGKMELSETGKIAQRFWVEIPIHFPFVKLGEFVVMPNHVHGIIIIDKPIKLDNDDCIVAIGDSIGDVRCDAIVETPNLGVSTTIPTATIPTTTIPMHTNETTKTAAASQKWKPKILGSIINQYKRICTINARKIDDGFAWQSRFYDHIIHNHESFRRISNYIINNPVNWQDDKFFNE
jgi:putative transposase